MPSAREPIDKNADHGVPGAGEPIDKETILTIPCNVLVPAAIGGVLTESTALHVDCKFIVEAANGPTTPGGDQVLRERGITVLPDIYTNGGESPPMRAGGLHFFYSDHMTAL